MLCLCFFDVTQNMLYLVKIRSMRGESATLNDDLEPSDVFGKIDELIS